MAPKIVNKDEKRLAIVEAAVEVFAQKGYRAATMEEISRRADIAKGTTYLYFKSKRDLFLAVFDWYVEQMIGQAETAMGGTERGAAEMLGLFLEATLDSMKEVRDLFPLYMEFWAASATGEQRALFGEHMLNLYRNYRAVLRVMIDQGIASGEFGPETRSEELASFLVGAMDGLMVQAWLDPEMDMNATAKSSLGLIIRGLAPGTGRGEQ